MSRQTRIIHVVVGVVVNKERKVLVALRPTHVDQGDLWEFPGGKIELGETPKQALARELKEEIDIDLIAARPLIQLPHQYPNKEVFLDVWEVTEFAGEPKACEGQPLIKWVSLHELKKLAIPAANHPIVQMILDLDSV